MGRAQNYCTILDHLHYPGSGESKYLKNALANYERGDMMKRIPVYVVVFCFCLACGGSAHLRESSHVRGTHVWGNKVSLRYDLAAYKLSEGVWLHRSLKMLDGDGLVSSNGLLVVTSDGSVLIDTPWTEAQTSRLLDWAENSQEAAVSRLVISHDYKDQLGGIRIAKARA